MLRNRENTINKLCEVLLKSAETEGIDLLRNAVDKLLETLESIECSLWYVNTNKHKHRGLASDSTPKSTSLIYRKMAQGVDYIFDKDTDFVHSLDACLFKQVMDICKKSDVRDPVEFVRCNRKKVEGYNYLSVDFLKYLDENGLPPNDFIVIPIISQINDEEIIAILEFCFTSASFRKNQWTRMAKIIRSFFSSAFNRYAMISKHKLMADLVKAHRQSRDYSMSNIFMCTIDVILKKEHYPCESVTFFMWDTYNNRYNLVYTSCAINSEDKKSICYRRGDGIIGQVAANNRAEIIDDIELQFHNKTSLWLYGIKKPKTAMIIPISRISSKNEVVGILQLVNKKNSNGSKELIDYFSELDLDIIRSTASYMALTIEYFIKEEEQRNFVDKLSHELMTPARSIRNDAERIIRNKDKKEFVDTQLYSYIEDIRNLTETQLWQVKSNLFQIKNPNNRKSKYKTEKVLLTTILKKSKEAVKSIAREYNVRFDAIIYTESLARINVDEDAFITVFYNLFTNAIKYHDRLHLSSFSVKPFYRPTGHGTHLSVADNGVGIYEHEKDNIFHIGYRGTNVMRFSADGFGVGLTTVKQIIEDFGGTIEVTNLKQPTRFTIRLPKNIICND